MTSEELLPNYQRIKKVAVAKSSFIGDLIDYYRFLKKYGLYTWKAKNKRGEEATFYKLRTIDPLEAKNPAGLTLKSNGKVEGQKPYNNVASLLRKLHFDEIPQLLNLYRGDIGFLGRRPYPEEELLKNFSGEDLKERLKNGPNLINLDYWCQGRDWEETVKNGTGWLKNYSSYKQRHGHALGPVVEAISKFVYNKVIKRVKSE